MPLPPSWLSCGTFILIGRRFHFCGWGGSNFDEWRSSSANTLPECHWNFSHDVLFMLPQLSAGSFVYTRLLHTLLTFVAPIRFPVSWIRIRISIRKTTIRTRFIGILTALKPLPFSPVRPFRLLFPLCLRLRRKLPLLPRYRRKRRPLTFPLWFRLLLALPLPTWRTT